MPHDPVSIERNVIQLFEQHPETENLGQMLKQMNYEILDGFSPSSTDPARILAAVVADDVTDALDICANLPATRPQVLVSSNTDFSFRLSAARYGVDAIVDRPVNANDLADWLEQFKKKRLDISYTILIVDDDELVSEINAEILRASGLTVHIVNDPAMALARIEEIFPDLVLMDMQMPRIDGIELARIIRQSKKLVSLPIVFLSAERDEALQMLARRHGGDDFITKPIDPAKLVSIVKMRAERGAELRSLIERDGLTGLYNHSSFMDRLGQELERCRRVGTQVTLAMIDIDHFKKVNDTFGHPSGDRVIRSLANLLNTSLRKIDVVGRYGGEEFAVILLDTDISGAVTVLDKIRAKFALTPFSYENVPFKVTLSAGVASSQTYKSVMDIVAAADDALYSAKNFGRNQVVHSTLAGRLVG